MPHTIKKDFSFTFLTQGNKFTLKVPVCLPLSTSVTEFCARLVNAHTLPCFVVKDLEKNLHKFVTDETARLHDRNADEAVRRVKNEEKDADNLISQWLPAFCQELKQYAKPYELSKDERFAEVYHSLIHSPALETLLNLEHEYSLGVDKVIKERDQDIHHLQSKQRSEMDEALANIGGVYKDEDINTLAQRLFENTQIIESKWQNELNSLHEQQKNEYREWMFRVHEDSQGNASLPSYL